MRAAVRLERLLTDGFFFILSAGFITGLFAALVFGGFADSASTARGSI